MMSSKTKKFEHTALKVISDTLMQEVDLDHETFGLINISSLVVSSDRSYLDIYVSCFKNSDALTKYMSDYANILQKKLGQNIQTYKIPKIRFRYDDSWEIGQNIQNTLSAIKNEM